MSGLLFAKRKDAYLLDAADLKGLEFNTPLPFYDTAVPCGNPMDLGDVPKVMIMMPDELVGPYETYCTRATGDSMADLGIMTGDMLVMENVPEYYSHDIVLAEIDGEKTLKTYYVDEAGSQWLIPANKKYKATKLNGNMHIVFKGRLKHHIRRAPHDSMQHIIESIEEAKELMKSRGAESEEFKMLVVKPECADKVVGRLHELSDGKLKPRDMLMPFRAAKEHRGQVSVSLKDLVYYFNKFLPLFPFSTCIFCYASSRLCIIVFRRSGSSNGRCRAPRHRIVDNGRLSVFLSSRR